MTHAVGMPAVQPSTERPDELRRAGLDAGHREHVAQPDAGPLGVADELAADLVADAGDRHVLLDQRQLGELGVGQRHLAVDHAVDAQRPARDVDDRGRAAPCRSGRSRRSGTTSGVRSGLLRGRRRPAGRRPSTGAAGWPCRRAADRRGRWPLEQPSADDAGGGRRRRRRAPAWSEEAAPRPVGIGRARPGRRRGPRRRRAVRSRKRHRPGRRRSPATRATIIEVVGAADGVPSVARKPASAKAANPPAASGERAPDGEDAEAGADERAPR